MPRLSGQLLLMTGLFVFAGTPLARMTVPSSWTATGSNSRNLIVFHKRCSDVMQRCVANQWQVLCTISCRNEIFPQIRYQPA